MRCTISAAKKTAEPRVLIRLRRLCLSMPDTFEKISHGEPTFWAGKRTFAMFANAGNHHGAGRHAVWCKSDHTTQQMLIARDPDRYFSPPYVGVGGWVGINLDREVDWDAVAERLEHGHALARVTKPRGR